MVVSVLWREVRSTFSLVQRTTRREDSTRTWVESGGVEEGFKENKHESRQIPFCSNMFIFLYKLLRKPPFALIGTISHILLKNGWKTSSARKFANLYSRTFHKSSKFGTNFHAISRKYFAKTTFFRLFQKFWLTCEKLQKFGTNFRAISRKLSFCAKMRENLSARKFLRIRQLKNSFHPILIPNRV